MKEGSFVEIEYAARIKESNELFDTTDAELAKKEGIFNPRARYGPVPIIVGAGHVIKGLERALLDMKVGERKTVEIEPKDAFGERNPKLIRTLPSSYFTREGITPRVGMPFFLSSGIEGRVISVSQGRVRVDFNSPLAGKKVIYEVEIKREIKDPEEKLESLFVYHTMMPKEGYSIKVEDGVGTIETKMSIGEAIRKRIEDEAKKYIPEIKQVVFKEVERAENNEKIKDGKKSP